jgi:hypothetical protein
MVEAAAKKSTTKTPAPKKAAAKSARKVKTTERKNARR